MIRLWNFFKSDNNKESMPRLLQFLAWPPATAVLLWVHTAEALEVYLFAFVLNGVAHKGIDMWGKSRQRK